MKFKKNKLKIIVLSLGILDPPNSRIEESMFFVIDSFLINGFRSL